MAIIASDIFDRTVASGLGTADTGQAWSVVYGSNWAVSSGSAIWSWNSGDPGGPGNNATLAVLSTGFVDGKTSATLVNVESMPTFANGVGIAFRCVDANYLWQCLLYKFLSSSRIRLQRIYAGVGPFTALDISIPGGLSNGDILSVGYCGDDFEVFVNDVSLGTYDASASPQNYGSQSGFVTQTGSWFAAYNQRWDNFLVETFGTCTPTYDCTGGACVDPGDGSGEFATLAACLDGCAVAVSYDCIDDVCADPGDGTGAFSTLAACVESGCGSTTESVEAFRFDAGTGSSYYLVPPVVDSDSELRSKVVKPARVTGKRTNQSIQAYGYDVGTEISVSDLEDGLNSSTGAIALDDNSNVSQSPRVGINVPNATSHTVRIAGDDTGESTRDQIHEAVYEVAQQGVRR